MSCSLNARTSRLQRLHPDFVRAVPCFQVRDDVSTVPEMFQFDDSGPTQIPIPFPVEVVLDTVVDSLVFASSAIRRTWRQLFTSDPAVAVFHVRVAERGQG